MSEAVTIERPAWRVSGRRLAGVACGLAALSLLAGRFVYQRYAGYRPLALAHVPNDVRYRARVEVSDKPRMDAVRPLLVALDPRERRLAAAVRAGEGDAQRALHEVAFGSGPAAADFVVVLGLQLPGGTGLPAAKAWCEAAFGDGIPSRPNETGCQLADGAIVAGTPDGALVVASRPELVKGLLGVPDIGDRLGFSGPSARGTAPEVPELGREAEALARRLSAQYP